PLPPEARLHAGDVDGDGTEDLVVADPSRGTLVVWTRGRRRVAPSLAGGVEEIVLADLQGDGAAEIVTRDRAGRLEARAPFDARTRRLGTTAPEARLLRGDVDGDGRHELLTAHGGMVEVWEP
ncbi:MAG: VCBS repeat-containing protein, partial [Myxococcota bacterium]|nr:VCBS repeat-containing protein [Myxococcota bacterium]